MRISASTKCSIPLLFPYFRPPGLVRPCHRGRKRHRTGSANYPVVFRQFVRSFSGVSTRDRFVARTDQSSLHGQSNVRGGSPRRVKRDVLWLSPYYDFYQVLSDSSSSLDFRDIGRILQSLQATAAAAEARYDSPAAPAPAPASAANDSMSSERLHSTTFTPQFNRPAFTNSDEFGELLANDFDPV